MRSPYRAFARSKKLEFAREPYAEAAFEKVPCRNKRERSVDAGFPSPSVFAPSVSFVILCQPSWSPALFHTFLHNAAASFGSARLNALSATTFPTFMRTTFIALLAIPRVFVTESADRTVTQNRT